MTALTATASVVTSLRRGGSTPSTSSASRSPSMVATRDSVGGTSGRPSPHPWATARAVMVSNDSSSASTNRSRSSMAIPLSYTVFGRRASPILQSVGEDIHRADAVGQAELVRAGAVKPLELVDAAIDRIERTDATINAVVIRRFERAREEAQGDLPDGPFRGVPIVLKDSHPSAADPFHQGSMVLKEAGYVATDDSAMVARLRAAGFVFLGRTNVPEFCSWPSTEPIAYGPTRNPWD